MHETILTVACSLARRVRGLSAESRLAVSALVICLTLLGGPLTHNTQAQTSPISFTVYDDVVHEVDHRIFGHFLERPSWGGETGIEAAVDPATGRIRSDVVELLRAMEIPLLRFPGGTDVELMDWLDMIDNAPGRAPERPVSVGRAGDTVTNRFGIDEALQLSEDLGSEMILVVNFFDGFDEIKPLEDAARHAAGLVAYANLPVGAPLPEGMYDWPSLRARNGRYTPYNVRYVQVANEPWIHTPALVRLGPIPDSLKVRYFETMEAYVRAIREVDPDIRIIVDGNSEELVAPLRERLGDRVQYVAYHIYQPWGIREVRRAGEVVDPASLSAEEVWNAWASTPEMDEEGNAVFDNPHYSNALASGYPVAVTEWNWNGWWALPDQAVSDRMPAPKMAQGLGAAGFLHAMMREGGDVKIGIQSMLVGQSWDITGIRVDSLDAKPPHMYPTGQVTDLYSKHHGPYRLRLNHTGVPVYEQPYRMHHLQPKLRVATIDALVTRSDDALFFHAINRSYTDPYTVTIDVSAFPALASEGVLRSLQGSEDNTPHSPDRPEIGYVSQERVLVRDGVVEVLLPKQSVSVIEIPYAVQR
jgi:alpha-L-arabinofuranosidase